MDTMTISDMAAHVERLGVVLTPDGSAAEAEGVLNPATARTRDGRLLLFPRSVSAGNVSRIGLCRDVGTDREPRFERDGFALEPSGVTEVRSTPGGYGCEDPRITFIPLLDAYLMAYTAFGVDGPRIAFAISDDAFGWTRLGLADFSAEGVPKGDDKDAVFFPEPVLSPAGVRSFAFYHRPMVHVPALNPCAAAPMILAKPPAERECTRIAYVPVEPVLADRRALCNVAESALVLLPNDDWGPIKNGGGTPPVRIAEGWLSFFHGVDRQLGPSGECISMRYQGGIVIHDYERPHIVRYRSPAPIISPETPDECSGTVANVVFPTGIDIVPGAPDRTFEIYYGMADAKIGRARVTLAPT